MPRSPSIPGRPRRELAASLALIAVALCPGCESESAPAPIPTTPSLRELASERGILIGAAVSGGALSDEAAYRETLGAQFNSITAEGAMKWRSTEDEHQSYTWDGADAIAAFAADNDQGLRGHTLIWANEYQYQVLPDYVKNAPDAATMQQYVDDHIEAVVTRYADVTDRWDVINEPLETLGTDVEQNVLTATLGEAWMVRAFQQARALDPDAKLYINEALAEWPGPKHEGLLALVERLLAAGAPIDGVGLQSHFLIRTPTTEELVSVMEDWEALGVEVAITELDIPMRGDAERQAQRYSDIVTACLSVSACVEVTLWGFTDRHTWLNSFLGPDSEPLLFDADYQPKPAFAAVREALMTTPD